MHVEGSGRPFSCQSCPAPHSQTTTPTTIPIEVQTESWYGTRRTQPVATNTRCATSAPTMPITALTSQYGKYAPKSDHEGAPRAMQPASGVKARNEHAV